MGELPIGKFPHIIELTNYHDHPKTNVARRSWFWPLFDKNTSFFKSLPRSKPSGNLHPPQGRRQGQRRDSFQSLLMTDSRPPRRFFLAPSPSPSVRMGLCFFDLAPSLLWIFFIIIFSLQNKVGSMKERNTFYNSLML